MDGREPVMVRELFPELRECLLGLLGGLTEAQWQAPTVCAGWSVHDVALHLLGVTVANISRRRDGYAGNFSTFVPAGAGLDDPDTLVAALNAWNEAWVLAARRISPRLLCHLLDVTGQELEAHFRSLDLMAPGDPVNWAGPHPAPVWLDVAREYTEHWTHQAQIRDALGAPALDTPRLFAPVLATFMHALPYTLRTVARPPGTRLELVIRGPAGGRWVVERFPQGWAFVDGQGVAFAARVSLDQDTAWRLVTKGLSPADALARVELAGDPELARAALGMVAIIG